MVAQTVKNLPARQETQIWSLGWEDPLEKGMVTHSSALARRIPWTEEPRMLQSIGSQRIGHNWATMVNTKIRLIIFFAAKDGEAVHSQQKQDLELTVAQVISFS